jgi:hypothetical protein
MSHSGVNVVVPMTNTYWGRQPDEGSTTRTLQLTRPSQRSGHRSLTPVVMPTYHCQGTHCAAGRPPSTCRAPKRAVYHHAIEAALSRRLITRGEAPPDPDRIRRGVALYSRQALVGESSSLPYGLRPRQRIFADDSLGPTGGRAADAARSKRIGAVMSFGQWLSSVRGTASRKLIDNSVKSNMDRALALPSSSDAVASVCLNQRAEATWALPMPSTRLRFKMSANASGSSR